MKKTAAKKAPARKKTASKKAPARKKAAAKKAPASSDELPRIRAEQEHLRRDGAVGVLFLLDILEMPDGDKRRRLVREVRRRARRDPRIVRTYEGLCAEVGL